jgi:hypothetical protein
MEFPMLFWSSTILSIAGWVGLLIGTIQRKRKKMEAEARWAGYLTITLGVAIAWNIFRLAYFASMLTKVKWGLPNLTLIFIAIYLLLRFLESHYGLTKGLQFSKIISLIFVPISVAFLILGLILEQIISIGIIGGIVAGCGIILIAGGMVQHALVVNRRKKLSRE